MWRLVVFLVCWNTGGLVGLMLVLTYCSEPWVVALYRPSVPGLAWCVTKDDETLQLRWLDSARDQQTRGQRE